MAPHHAPLPSRRQFLGTLAAATAAAATLPVYAQPAQKKNPAPAAAAGVAPGPIQPASSRNAFVYKFGIGDIEAWSISDGHMVFKEGLGLMWPEAARPAMKDDLAAHGERLDALPLYVNILVARIGNEIVLFDAGFGVRPNNREIGWVNDALASIGIAPGQITQAFLSHAHGDHIGGFVTDNKAIFPNAALHCLKAEVDFWRSPEPDFSRSKRAKGPLPNMIKDARNKFDVLQPNLQLHAGATKILNGAIEIEPALGHTSGHAMFRLRSGKESLLHFMDVAHHHTLMFTDPAWGIAFDHDPEQAVDTRKKLFAQLAATNERSYGFHLPWPGIGRVVPRKQGGYSWIGERWSWGS
ncbi:MAG: MBL fold metallo-hydrolase [Verrucomicrobiota bacterium]